MREGFSNRAGIEPGTGHLKTDHRLSRNFYKGIKGDKHKCDVSRFRNELQKDDEYLQKEFFGSFF